MNQITTQELVKRLIEKGKSPIEISELMESRVSARTIYRWLNGESIPGNSSDLLALFDVAKLYADLTGDYTPVLGEVAKV